MTLFNHLHINPPQSLLCSRIQPRAASLWCFQLKTYIWWHRTHTWNKGEEDVMGFTQVLGNFINLCAGRLLLTPTRSHCPHVWPSCALPAASSPPETEIHHWKFDSSLPNALPPALRPLRSTAVHLNKRKLIHLPIHYFGNLHPPRALSGTPHWAGPRFFVSSIPK